MKVTAMPKDPKQYRGIRDNNMKTQYRDVDITLTEPIPLYQFLKLIISHRSLKVVKL
tara:strand:- start:1021 stop:1191 length:171 start_codon:yes stop_codon:yes gene_type:complete